MSDGKSRAPVSQDAAGILLEIHERRRSTMVIASGMGGVLAKLEAYILNTEARIHELEQRKP